MIISRTPFRVSLFGGGTDYPAWFREHGGAVLGMAIDKYCYITLRHLPPFFEHRHRIVYSKIENIHSVEEIQHPAVRAILKKMRVEKGVEIHHDGDLPARSGIGSSSSFSVGLLNALYALEGRIRSKMQLAEEAMSIEQIDLSENVGCQDQIWAACGGFNRINFSRDGKFNLSPVIMNQERLQTMLDSFVLYFTGFSRFSSEIAKKQLENMPAKNESLRTIQSMVNEAEAILTDDKRSLDELGTLLNEGWKLKRGLAKEVSTEAIDEIYQAGREEGALGGKLLGAGGGGFILFYANPKVRKRIRERLKHLIEINFDIDRAGSSIVFYQPNGLGNS